MKTSHLIENIILMKKDNPNLLVLSFLFLAYFFCSQCASQNITDLSPEITKRARYYLNPDTHNYSKSFGKPIKIIHGTPIIDPITELEETRQDLINGEVMKYSFQFHESGRIASEERSKNGQIVESESSTFDEKGNFISNKNKYSNRKYEYDENHFLTKEFYEPQPHYTLFEYEGLTETQTTYDVDKKITLIKTITYNEDSLIAKQFTERIKKPDGWTTSQTFEYGIKDFLWETKFTNILSNGRKIIIEQYFDSNGIIKEIKTFYPETKEYVIRTYKHEFLGQDGSISKIIQSVFLNDNPEPRKRATFELDQRGNWTKQTLEDKGKITEIRERVISYRN